MFWYYEINDYPLWSVLWNVFLLAMPFLLHQALVLVLAEGRPWRLAAGVLLALAWLAFLPNAAYVMADVRHVDRICPPLYFRNCVNNAWMIMFFYAYSVLGWVAFTLAIRQMSASITGYLGAAKARLFTAAMMPLTALGVLLGLFDRLNSWDLFVRPLLVLDRALLFATDWERGKNLVLYTVFLAFLYFLGQLFIKSVFVKYPE